MVDKDDGQIFDESSPPTSDVMPPMPNAGGGSSIAPRGRLTTPCKVLVCSANDNGKCRSPSMIRIMPDGRCELGVASLARGEAPQCQTSSENSNDKS